MRKEDSKGHENSHPAPTLSNPRNSDSNHCFKLYGSYSCSSVSRHDQEMNGICDTQIQVISALSLITLTALADGRSSIMHWPFSIHQDLSVTINNAAIMLYDCDRNCGPYYQCYNQERHQKRFSRPSIERCAMILAVLPSESA